MSLNQLSALWTSIAPGIGNHLWQSTLFAIAAGLLTLVCEKNHARARYWLWFAASVKFLIPFRCWLPLAAVWRGREFRPVQIQSFTSQSKSLASLFQQPAAACKLQFNSCGIPLKSQAI